MGPPGSFHIKVGPGSPLNPLLSFPFPGALAVARGQRAMPGAVERPSWKQAEDIRDIYNFRDVLGT